MMFADIMTPVLAMGLAVDLVEGVGAVVSTFFFFKQKTAYEMDGYWSSDVCSSDLPRRGAGDRERLRRGRDRPDRPRTASGAGDRRRGGAKEQRDHRHGRAAAGRAAAERADLRRYG